MTASRDIKICRTGTKLVGSPLRHPTGVPYPNGNVASVIPTIFQTMRTDSVTWNVHDKMEEAEGGTESGMRYTNGQRLRSG